MHLHHEGSMIGVQCQLMICRGHIRPSKGTFKIFLWLTVAVKIDILVKFCTLFSFQLRFQWVVNGSGGQNHLRAQSKYGLMGSSAKTRKNFFRGSPEHFLDKNAIWDRTPPPTYTSIAVYMCGGGFKGPKSLNGIQLSRFVQKLWHF